ncbi:hypothetical protein A2U01_0104906, partial [Trifolium medium]|nr:hypothetical protein [Trifolium medium]
EDDQPASEGKGKEKIVSAADNSPLKKSGKDKAEVVVKEREKRKEKKGCCFWY